MMAVTIKTLMAIDILARMSSGNLKESPRAQGGGLAKIDSGQQ